MNPANQWARIAVGIGANLGDARQAVSQTLEILANHHSLSDVRQSSLYRSTPIDATGPDYINAAVIGATSLKPLATLDLLQSLETQAGRERPYPNAPRLLDLDLLLYDNLQMSSDRLNLPHPRMHLRAFVLTPLLEIDPALKIPGKGSASTWLDQVSDQTIALVQ